MKHHDYIYLIENPALCWYKIGFSSQPPEERFKELKRHWASYEDGVDGYAAVLVAYAPGSKSLERFLHKMVKAHHHPTAGVAPFRLPDGSLASKGAREYFEMVPEVREAFFNNVEVCCNALDLDAAVAAWDFVEDMGGEPLERARKCSIVYRAAEEHIQATEGVEGLHVRKRHHEIFRDHEEHDERPGSFPFCEPCLRRMHAELPGVPLESFQTIVRDILQPAGERARETARESALRESEREYEDADKFVDRVMTRQAANLAKGHAPSDWDLRELEKARAWLGRVARKLAGIEAESAPLEAAS